MLLRPPLGSHRSWGPLATIREESASVERTFADPFADKDYDDVSYRLDLGSESRAPSRATTPTPTPMPQPLLIRRPIPSRAFCPPRSGLSTRKERSREAARDCAICFEPAVAPVRTRCCSQLFCGEHIAAWLDDPRADGCCPSCRAPLAFTDAGLLALGHPSLLMLTPRTPPPSRAPTPPLFTVTSAAPYASYPKTPVASVPRARAASSAATSPATPTSSHPPASLSSLSSSEDDVDADVDIEADADEEDEDRLLLSHTFSLPALVRARALQTRRHTRHPFSCVFGVRGALVSTVRIALWVVVVGVLAARARGRWGAPAEGADPGLMGVRWWWFRLMIMTLVYWYRHSTSVLICKTFPLANVVVP
ncbi:hypothetical protein GGX14DRAFT_695748 [Mycena pura]|uniref:RING-type domain-containing protein n=1 Tax=Mycena pura TaxID=153505 RepID=A0AAD6YGJ2_9AGAR|nr:hypothetical protein GGX14DRAFT_695748 [Mycena pura]